MMANDITSNKCPICGNDNNCCIAKGHITNHCWCMEQDIPKQLLKELPTRVKSSCICKQCIDDFNSGKLTKIDLFHKFYRNQ